MHPLAVEHRRKLYTRQDAWRLAPPGTPEAKMPGWLDPSATRVRWKEAQEAEAWKREAAAQEDFERDLLELRWLVKSLRTDLLMLGLDHKYSPDQPRDELGRWTDAGGASQSDSTDSSVEPTSARQVLSDETPDPIRPGAQYAQTRIEIQTGALIGIDDVDRTTIALADRLGKVVDTLPEGSGPLYGIMVHTEFKASLLIDPIPNVTPEPTFGGSGIYGSKESIRPDAVLRSPTGDIRAFYDVKTGVKGIEPDRAAEFRAFSTSNVPVIELSLRRGALLKSMR
jgi:hypothetical protein